MTFHFPSRAEIAPFNILNLFAFRFLSNQSLFFMTEYRPVENTGTYPFVAFFKRPNLTGAIVTDKLSLSLSAYKKMIHCVPIYGTAWY